MHGYLHCVQCLKKFDYLNIITTFSLISAEEMVMVQIRVVKKRVFYLFIFNFNKKPFL